MCPARAGLDGIIPTENILDYIILKFGIILSTPKTHSSLLHL